MKYKVRDGCRIEHDGKSYAASSEVELSPELALFHASNIVVPSELKTEKTKSVVLPKQEKSGVDVS